MQVQWSRVDSCLFFDTKSSVILCWSLPLIDVWYIRLSYVRVHQIRVHEYTAALWLSRGWITSAPSPSLSNRLILYHAFFTLSLCHLPLGLLLLLILNQLHIILRHLKLLDQKLQNILTQIALDRDLLSTPGYLRDT
jgi:hypothetical protein